MKYKYRHEDEAATCVVAGGRGFVDCSSSPFIH